MQPFPESGVLVVVPLHRGVLLVQPDRWQKMVRRRFRGKGDSAFESGRLDWLWFEVSSTGCPGFCSFVRTNYRSSWRKHQALFYRPRRIVPSDLGMSFVPMPPPEGRRARLYTPGTRKSQSGKPGSWSSMKNPATAGTVRRMIESPAPRVPVNRLTRFASGKLPLREPGTNPLQSGFPETCPGYWRRPMHSNNPESRNPIPCR